MEFRHRVHKIFFERTPGDQLRKNIEIIISILIIASIIAIVLESDSGLHQQYDSAFNYFEILTVTFFTLEYLLRIWSAPPPPGCHAIS